MENVVTRIEVQKKNKKRVNVYIDNEFAFSCSAEIIYLEGIKLNKVIDREALSQVIFEDNYIKAKDAALKYIEKYYKSQHEVVERLKQKGYETQVISRVIDFLKKYDFIDDSKYALMYIKEKIKTQGKYKIKFSLLKKGISDDIIEEELESVDGDTEVSAAMKLGLKKYNSLVKTESDSRKLYKKVGDFLIRNGYNFDIAKRVMNKIFNKEGSI